MATSSWLVLAGVCLLYIALGFWAVSQIFPNRSTDRKPDPDRQPERLRT